MPYSFTRFSSTSTSLPLLALSFLCACRGGIIYSSVRGVAGGGGGWEAHVEVDALGGVMAGVDLREAVEVAGGGVVGVRDEEGHPLPLCGYGGVDLLQKVGAVVERADHHGVGVPGA